MNIRKTAVRYSWFFALLVIAGYFLLFRYKHGTINPSIKEFAVKDTSSITSFILSNDSIKLTLNRTEKVWLLNNSYKIRSGAVQSFFNVINRLKASSPIPKSVADSLEEEIDSKGINVKVFDNENIIKEYNVYSTNTLNLGTIGKLKDADVGFTLQIIGFNDDISRLFVLDQDYWKSNKLFIADINQISKIDVEIPDNPEKSFSITLSEKNIQLKATYFDKTMDAFDTSRVVNFIMGLTNLSFDKLLNKSTLEDRAAIVLSQPSQIFTISLINKNKLVLKTYPIPIDEYRDEFGRTIKFDLNKLYISFNNDAIIAVASYLVFDPVLKDLSSFQKKHQ